MEQTIDPTADQIRRLAGADDDGRIVMLNLLRFKERATGIDAGDGISGREAYERYGAAVSPYLAAAGGRLSLLATGHETVIGPEAERWDMVLLAEYPSSQAFLEMIADPAFQAAHAHRAAALEDSRLICCARLDG